MAPDRNLWSTAFQNRRVLVTGHTGFKGGWLALWLSRLGARVTGFSLPVSSDPSMFKAARIRDKIEHVEGDVRDFKHLSEVWERTEPEVVFHLAAQAIVRESYADPLRTVTTNTLGTAHILELCRQSSSVRAGVLITSDKCYENFEWERGYAETDRLGGRDIYSGSKAAAELLISSYRRSFARASFGIASARAGNVIGGGDWSPDRIVPDIVRSLTQGRTIPLRNPAAVRPWQHVLEPLSGYMTLACLLLSPDQTTCSRTADSWNFGPTIDNTRTVGELAKAFVQEWGQGTVEDCSDPNQPHEAGLLRLDITKATTELAWKPRWSFEQAIARTARWYKAYYDGANMASMSEEQISEYEEGQ